MPPPQNRTELHEKARINISHLYKMFSLSYLIFLIQHPVHIEDDLYDTLLDILQNGMPPAQNRTEMHEKARTKKYSLQRAYDLQCAPFDNPATNKVESRIVIDGRVVLKRGDKDTLIKWHR